MNSNKNTVEQIAKELSDNPSLFKFMQECANIDAEQQKEVLILLKSL